MAHACTACREGATSCNCDHAKPRKSYSFKEGLAMMAAKDAGIDPYLAAEAGDNAKAALNHLRQATKAKYGTARTAHIRNAQTELQSLSAAKHPKLVNAIQAKLLALQGRGGDTEIAHVTPGEVVIPRSLQTPAIMKQIAALAKQRGIDPAQLAVGNRANRVNPKTGQREFAAFGWRKASWQGARDEARDAERYGEVTVTGNRDWHNQDWSTQINPDLGNYGVRNPDISFEPNILDNIPFNSISDGVCTASERARFNENNSLVSRMNDTLRQLRAARDRINEIIVNSENADERAYLRNALTHVEQELSYNLEISKQMLAEHEALRGRCGEKEI